MAISLNPSTLAAVNGFLKQAGMAIDPKSTAGVKVSVEEAKNLATAFEKIEDPQAKKLVASAMLQLLQSDVFEVPSKGAQEALAKVVGKPASEVFSAREKAELAGGNSIKSVATMALGLLAKAPNLDKAAVEKIVKGLDELPKEVKNLAYAVLNNAGKDGAVKMNAPDARSVFTKGYAKAEAESGGAVSKMAESFKEPAGGAMEYFSSQMANSPYFEDRLAALMFLVCAKGMKEVDESLRSLDNTIKDDVKGRDKKKAQTTPSPSTATGQLGQITKGEKGGPTTSTGQTRQAFEALVQSAASHRADDGIITLSESKALVTKLDALTPPEAKKLQAEAMGRALLAAGGGDVTPEMKPLADWVETTTGKKLTDIGDAKALYEAKTPLAQTIGGSDKLENKVAAFILEGIFGEGKAPKMKEVMGEMKPLFQAMEQQVTGTTVEAEKSVTPKTSQHSTNIEDRFTRIATAVQSGKIPVADLAKTAASMVERLPIAGIKKPVLDGITEGLTALAGDKTLDVKSVFQKSVAPLVDASKTPETESVIGGAVDAVRNHVAGKIFDAKDINKPLGKEEVAKMLEDGLGKSKAALLQQGTTAGYNPQQLEALGVAFDAEANKVRADLKKDGTLTSTEPRGQGTDAADPMESDESRSRQVMFEKVKLQMNRLSEMMQAMSNILNTLHQTAENAIRAIR